MRPDPLPLPLPSPFSKHKLQLPRPKRLTLREIGPLPWGIFIAVLMLTLVVSTAVTRNRIDAERFTMERLALEHSARISTVLERTFQRGYIFGEVVASLGNYEDFLAQLAYNLTDDPAIMSLSIAPRGIVSSVFPLEDNEVLLGLNFFQHETRAEAYDLAESRLLSAIAKETGKFVIGGPFPSARGSDVLVGRYPVFIKNVKGIDIFWGIVGITLRFPEAIGVQALEDLELLGFNYEIWRVDPLTGGEQVILGGIPDEQKNEKINVPIPILNTQWNLRVVSNTAWYQFPEPWLIFGLGLLASILGAARAHLYILEKKTRQELFTLSITDPLTGIYNRKYFMEVVESHINHLTEQNAPSYVVLFDLDHFKKVNDTYGHQGGDKVLIEITNLVKSMIRENDLLARYGGEEFILFFSGIDRNAIQALADRIRERIEKHPIIFGEQTIRVTSSFGSSYASPHFNLTKAIALADAALYEAKNTGRNRVVFNDDSHLPS